MGEAALDGAADDGEGYEFTIMLCGKGDVITSGLCRNDAKG